MALIDVDPFLLEDFILSVAGDDYAASSSTIELAPNTTIVTFKGLKPTSIHKRSVTDWVCNLTFAQDWTNDDSLSNFLFAHQGETVEDCTIKPQSGVGPSFTVDLTIAAGSVGGAVDSTAVSTVALGSTKPVLVPAA